MRSGRRGAPARPTLGPGVLERQRDGADGDVVTGLHGGLADALAVDGAAVGRVEIAEQEGVAVPDELGMPPRDAAVVEHHVALPRAPQHDGAAVEDVAAAGPAEGELLPREVGRARLAGGDEGRLARRGRLLVLLAGSGGDGR